MKKTLIIVFSILLIFIIVSVIAYIFYKKAINTENLSTKPNDIIEIESGTSTTEVAERLEELGAVKDSRIFWLYAKLSNKKIQAGMHTLVYSLSVKELTEKLSSGEYLLQKVTVPEGKRIEQIAAMMEDKKIFNYYDLLKAAEGNEGHLFPDTYYIAKKTTASDFVKMMLDNFTAKTSALNLSEQQLILASIIEREAINDDERPTIAGIFSNRLNIGMKLEADPTVLYANDSQKIAGITPYDATQYTFWQPISFSLYKTVSSPFNTYINSGLPPAPICSPGLESIKAAKDPETNNYFFFLHGSDGGFYPAANNSEHEINKDKYLF
jgi:UPF0755 protein